jgi:glycosyltransferase involved in cell wall biosynthesis
VNAGPALETASAPGSRPVRLAVLPAAVLPEFAGGATAHAAALAAGCRDAGLAVRVFAPAGMAALFGPGIAVEPTRIGERPRPVADAVEIARLGRKLRAWRPAVVHAHGVRSGAFAALALLLARGGDPPEPPAGLARGDDPPEPPAGLARGAGRRGRSPRLVVTVHNAPSGGLAARVLFRFLERLCAWRADAVLAASADLAARMRAAGATSVTLFEVPARPAAAPTDEEVAKARADIGANGRPVVLAVGRLAPQKGFDVLVAAAALWRERDNAPLTVIAGDGPQAAELRSLASEAGADVLLLGRRDDIPALLAVADVVVVPSRWEARALVVQEAMRAGRPLVATGVGGTTELTGEDGAVLIAPDDPAALAAAVTKVLVDPPLAAALVRAAVARSASFPTEKDALRAALELYARLAAGTGRQRTGRAVTCRR